jgi:excisionase family DNA binding protein
MVEEGGDNQGPGHVQSEDTGEREPETYSVEETAKVLGLTDGRVRQMLRAGELEGEHEGGDPRRPWRVPKWAVHALKDQQEERAREGAKTPREPTEGAAVLNRRV